MKKLLTIAILFSALTLLLAGCAKKTETKNSVKQTESMPSAQNEQPIDNFDDLHIDLGVDGVNVQPVK